MTVDTVAPANNLTEVEARERAALIRDVTYKLDFDLASSETHFTVRSEIRFTAAEEGSSTFIDLLAKDVVAGSLNGTPLAADAFDGVRVKLEGVSSSNVLSIESVHAFETSGIGLSRFVDPTDGSIYMFSDLEPYDAHRVYPCFDQPDIKGRFEFVITAAPDSTVLTNMRPVSEPVDGRWIFKQSPPMSTYVTCIAAGPLHSATVRHGDVELGVHCRKSVAEHLDPDEIFEITRAGFDFFQKQFDYPYMLEKFDQVFVPAMNPNVGAMENFGIVTINEIYVFRSKVTSGAREKRAETILHELAHMWFGDLVTMRWWGDLWLNESFATFESILALSEIDRFSHAWTSFSNGWKNWAYAADQLETTHPISTEMPDTDSVHVNFDGISYAKGCAVLRQLVAWVGPECFNEGLRAYFRKHEYANATLDDFLAELAAASGRDLSDWSKQWLESAGVNAVEARFELAGDSYGSFAIEQTAPETHPLRQHRLGIGLYDRKDSKLTLRRTIEVDIEGALTEVPKLAGEKVPDLLLLNDRDLAFTKIRLDERSIETAKAHLAELEDPLARALCWACILDMTRQIEIPVSVFLEMFIKNAPLEDGISQLEPLLTRASASNDIYVADENYESWRERIREVAHDALWSAAPGSDFQLAWTKLFVSRADVEACQTIQGWLDGKDVPEGLAVDQELRWTFLGALASNGCADEEMIEAESKRDPTDIGERNAASCLAARPSADAKKQAWERVTTEKDLPMAKRRAIMGGFQKRNQKELLQPYVDPYFAHLEVLASTDNQHEAKDFASAMFPATIVSEEVVAKSRAFSSRDDVPEFLRRPVAEHAEEMTRCLRARRLDSETVGSG